MKILPRKSLANAWFGDSLTSAQAAAQSILLLPDRATNNERQHGLALIHRKLALFLNAHFCPPLI
jgi:hypothetical protein